MYDYQVGGNAVKVDASEGMADIPMNRSMFVQKLTSNAPNKPEAVYNLKTMKDVFEHFRPSVEVPFERKDGSTINEELHFNSVADFNASSIVTQSSFLQDLNNEKDDYQKMMKQLKTNKLLRTVVENPETKASFISVLQSLIQELDNNK